MKTQKAGVLAAVILSALGAESAQASGPWRPSPVAYYVFEGPGTTAIDVAGGDDNGTISGGPTLVSPGLPSVWSSHALRFSGAGNVNLGADQDLLRAAPGVTLMAFIVPESLTTDGPNSIIGISGSTNINQARAVFQLASVTTDGVTTHNVLRFGGRQLDSDSFRSWTAPVETALEIGKTYHVAATADFATDTITLHINRVQVAEGVVDWADSPAVAEDATHLGAFIGAQSNGTGELFEGIIDEIRIYDQALPGWMIAGIVPEPGSMAVLATGALGLLARRRRNA